MKEFVSIVIPALNEERNLPRLLRNVNNLKRLYRLEVIVVDDGSTDNTWKVARKEGARVIRLRNNCGKGAAFAKGIYASRGDFIVQIDADYQFLPDEIPQFIDKLKTYDIVVGSRFNRGVVEKGSVSLVNLFGNWLMSITTSIFSGVAVTDIMAGFKGFRRLAARKLHLRTPHFGYEAEIIVKAGKYGFRVAEIPVHYHRRKIGTSSVNPLRDGLRVSSTIIRLYFSIPGPTLGYGIFGGHIKSVFRAFWAFAGIYLVTFVSVSRSITIPYPWPIKIYEILIFSYLIFFLFPMITGSFLAGLTASFVYIIISSGISVWSPFILDNLQKLVIIGLLVSFTTYGANQIQSKREPVMVKWLNVISFFTLACLFVEGISSSRIVNYSIRILISGWLGIIVSLSFLYIVSFDTFKDSLISKRRILLSFLLFGAFTFLLWLLSVLRIQV